MSSAAVASLHHWLSRGEVEVIYVDRIYVNDRNTDAAPRYTVANLRVGLEQQIGIVTRWIQRHSAPL